MEDADLVVLRLVVSLKRHLPSGFMECLAFHTVQAIMEATASKYYRVSRQSSQECDSHNMKVTIFTIQRPENSAGTPCKSPVLYFSMKLWSRSQ